MENQKVTVSVQTINNLYNLVKMAGDRGAYKFEEFATVAAITETLKQELAATPGTIVAANAVETTEVKDA